MRKFLLGVLALTGAMMAATSAASAQSPQSYPWCLVDDLLTGSWSCYYASRAQCQLSTGGNIGHCVANPGYVAAPAPEPRRVRR
jgi:hypothetical protein